MTENTHAGDTEDQRIPVDIITGFLGSGKTTLLNHWVNTPEFKDTLVLINEFGDVGLDHELVESVDDNVVLLGNGCICCTLQGALVDALASNFMRAQRGEIPAFSRVLIETTGLADPAGVIQTLSMDDYCYANYYYDGTVTILDGQFIRQQIKDQYEAVKQIALADVILISKTDLIDDAEVEAIHEAAAKINPSVQIYPVINGVINPKVLFDIGPYRDTSHQDRHKLSNWLSIRDQSVASPFHPAGFINNDVGVARPKIIAHSDIASFSLVREEALDPLVLMAAIVLVQQQFGDSILRIKGILHLTTSEKPVIVHGIQGNLYPLSTLESWHDTPKSRLVFIVRNSVKDQIEFMFQNALEHPDDAAIDYYRSVVNGGEAPEE